MVITMILRMIKDFADLDLKKEDTIESVMSKIEEKLGASFNEMKDMLSKYTLNKHEEISSQLRNVSPKGDYSIILEEPKEIDSFLQSEAYKVEYWQLSDVSFKELGSLPLIVFHFNNMAIDDGSSLTGIVYVNFNGKIKHHFVHGET